MSFRFLASFRFSAAALLLAVVASAPPAGFARAAEGDPLPGVVARVDGKPIQAEEFKAYLDVGRRRLADVPPGEREELLKEMITDRVMAQKSKAKGLRDSDRVTRSIEQMDRKVLPDILFRKEFLEKTTPEEADFAPYYEGVEETAEIRAAVLPEEGAARDLLGRARNGEAFAALAERHSEGAGASKGGYIEGVTRGDIRFTLEEKDAIFAGKPGALLGPYSNKLGSWSVLQVLSVRSVEEQKREIREAKRDEVRYRKANAAYLSRISDEMARTEIEINEEYFEEKPKEPATGAEAAKKAKKGEPKRPYLAWIRGRYIYPGDLEMAAAGGEHGKKDLRAGLDTLLRSIIASDLAKKMGLADTPEYKARRRIISDSVLSNLLLEDEFRKANFTVGEKEKKEYYATWFPPELSSLWIVMNADRAKVEAARLEVSSGKTPPEEVAQKYSDDNTRSRGGATGYLPLPALDPPVRSRVVEMKVGDLSEVFETVGKFAIVRLLDRKEFTPPAFAEVEEKIERQLLLKKRADLVTKRRMEAYRKASVKIDASVLAGLK